MNRINVNQASREELIEIVKQLRQQLRSGQAAVQRIGELEEQVAAQQRELTAHNETIRALTQQNARLSEKSASDEETISALIQQLEGQWQQHSQLGGEGGAEGNVLVARAVKSPSPLALPQKGSTGAKGPPFTVPAKGGAVALGQVSDIGNGTAVNARKSDVTAQLEAKVHEQTEIIAFYATALSQRDEEERRRAEAEAPATEAAEAAVETGEEWQWEEERGKEVKGRQAPSAQGQTESLPWWGTSGVSLHAGAVAPGANSFPPKTKSSSGGGGNGNKEKMATMTTSDPIAMDPRQEANDPFAFLATVAAPSGGGSARVPRISPNRCNGRVRISARCRRAACIP